MKIDIKNYQRLEDISIDLLPGINLVSGNSNNGKSSTIRAVRDFIFNKISKDKIRHGEKELEISIDNAKAIRNSKGVIYEIDGNKFEKVGRNILPEIKDKFNIDEVIINGISIRPNFWFQMDKPFLTDKTAGQKNDLLIGTKNDKYIACLKKIKAETTDLQKINKKYLEEYIDKTKQNILKNEERLSKLNGLELLLSKIDSLEEKSNSFQEIVNFLNEIKRRNEILSKQKNYTNKIKNALDSSENLKKLFIEYQSKKDKMQEVYDIYKSQCNISSELEYTENKKELLARGLTFEVLLRELFTDIHNKKLEEKELEYYFIQYEKLLKNEENIKKTLNENEKLLKTIKNEFDSFKKEIGHCPLCGGELNG